MKISYVNAKFNKNVNDTFLTKAIMKHIQTNKVSREPIMVKLNNLTSRTKKDIKQIENKIKQIEKTENQLKNKLHNLKNNNNKLINKYRQELMY